MEFKIDTKPNYTIISPVEGYLDAIMAQSLSEKCQELIESGSLNLVISLENCTEADPAGFDTLLDLHEYCYSNDHSIVFTEIADLVLQRLKKDQIHLSLNLAPSLIEAVDIISMEVLERDLFDDK